MEFGFTYELRNSAPHLKLSSFIAFVLKFNSRDIFPAILQSMVQMKPVNALCNVPSSTLQ